MRDRASMNGVAIQHINIMFPNLLDISCYSHTLGNKFQLPTVEVFISRGLASFPIAQRLGLNGKAKPGGQWCPIVKPAGGPGWEVFHQVVQQFGDVQPFLE